MNRYQKILILCFSAVWIWAAINPSYRKDWLLENLLVFLVVPLIIWLGRYFRFSQFSYILITVFMICHVIGSHYTYAEVPFGYTLQNWFGAERNMYDRLIHFGFGFLCAYPAREIFIRITRVKGFWGYFLPFALMLSLSGLYEILEMLTAIIVDPSAGTAFLGAQGDEWDAQKDMIAASLGAMLALIVILFINWKNNPNFRKDMRASFRLSQNDQPLEEVKLG